MITIERCIDELTIETWYFRFIDGNIMLQSYYFDKRESKRHRKYKTIKKYDRFDSRNSTLNEEDVVLTDKMRQEVLNQFMSTVRVLKWGEK